MVTVSLLQFKGSDNPGLGTITGNHAHESLVRHQVRANHAKNIVFAVTNGVEQCSSKSLVSVFAMDYKLSDPKNLVTVVIPSAAGYMTSQRVIDKDSGKAAL